MPIRSGTPNMGGRTTASRTEPPIITAARPYAMIGARRGRQVTGNRGGVASDTASRREVAHGVSGDGSCGLVRDH
ncbi:hypothetical protein GCM10009530_05520 [Microbispora corallina]|uniref:Uncharacterized protein n=1 Tax=Microbispora corallina TaxID=83302 RepID=A0ABQ4FQY6_9ACTN|nr:hypothetical protein Mco01_02220 [Microbispora corallina]